MFDPTKEVPSLEMCQKLKKLGYPQAGGGWYWVKGLGDYFIAWRLNDETLVDYYFFSPFDEGNIFVSRDREIIKAPTVRELGELILGHIVVRGFKDGVEVILKHVSGNKHFFADTEANARAKLVIWLAEEKGYNLRELWYGRV